MHPRLFLAALAITLLAGCGATTLTATTTPANAPTEITISRNPFECRAITYSCPQAYQSFDELTSGCGCRPNTAVTTSEAMSLRDVVTTYLTEHVLPRTSGKYFVEYVMLAADDKTPPNLNYQIWMVAQEYFFANGKLTKGALVSEPLALAITEHNTYFVIHSHQTPSQTTYDADVQALFLPDAVTWITARESEKGKAVIAALVKETENIAQKEYGIAPVLEFETRTEAAPAKTPKK